MCSAIEFKIFDVLEADGKRPKTAEEIFEATKIKAWRADDFLKALAGMGHITYDRETNKFSNTQETSDFCVSTSPLYVGEIFLFRGSIDRSGDFKNLTKYLSGNHYNTLIPDFGTFYDSQPGLVESFASYMEHSCKFVGLLLPFKIDAFWKSIRSFADIGGGSGYMSYQVCKAQTHLRAVSCDLKQCLPVFNEYISKESQSIKDRVSFRALDFFKEEMPTDVDALMFGNVIHDWSDENKRMLIKKSFNALPKGGHIVIYDFFLDQEEGKPPKLNNHLISLHMQLAATGSQFTRKEMENFLTEGGFGNIQFHGLDGTNDVMIGTKL